MKGRKRCRRSLGWSLSAFVCFSSPLFSVGVRLLSFSPCLRPSLSLLVFRSLSSLFSSVFFFWYSSVPPPHLCVFLFFTLYPFFLPPALSASFSPLLLFFLVPLFSLFLSFVLLSVISVFSFSPLPLVRGLSWAIN